MKSPADAQAWALEVQETYLARISPRTQFHQLFDHVEGLYFFAKDRAGRIMFANNACLARHGYQYGWEIVGKTDADLSPPHLAKAYVIDDEWVYRTGQPLLNRVELWLNPQRVPDWHVTSKFPIIDRSGSVIGIMGILHSYEGRKRHIEPYLAVADAVDYVNRNYDRPVTIAHLGRLCHLSVRQLERKFLAAFQMTPQQFISHTRIQYACEALLSSRRGISDIALATGFRSHSAFTRQFREQLGLTPRQYRQRTGTLR